MAEAKKETITLVDLVAEALELGGQEYVDLLYRVGPLELAPTEDWRFQVSQPDGSVCRMNAGSTAADIVAYLKWDQERRR